MGHGLEMGKYVGCMWAPHGLPIYFLAGIMIDNEFACTMYEGISRKF